MMDNQNDHDTQVSPGGDVTVVEEAVVGPSADFSVGADEPAPVPLSASMADYALDQDCAAGITETVQCTVSIAKPKKQEFVSPCPDSGARMTCYIMTDDESGEHYVLHPKLMDEFADECRKMVLVPYKLVDGSVRLWPVGLPDETGNWNTWHKSAHVIAGKYAGKWVRVIAVRGIGAYKAQEPASRPQAPDWSDVDIAGLYDDVLRASAIDNEDHPFLKKLRGADF
ncbi:hypothetical protein [Pontiella desulfatans]|nr:hypothetical protein [Pontiella desulfatans]